VDDGAAINIMPYTVYQKLRKGDQDLTKTDMMLKDFEGNVSPVKVAICVELTIGRNLADNLLRDQWKGCL